MFYILSNHIQMHLLDGPPLIYIIIFNPAIFFNMGSTKEKRTPAIRSSPKYVIFDTN